MHLIERRVPYKSKSDTFNLFALGDVHVGNIGFAKDKFERTIRSIRDDPRALVILMGDLADAIVPTDPRFDARTIHPDFLGRIQDIAVAEYEYLERTLEPIKEKVIVCLAGNHEETIRKRHYLDLTNDLCRRLQFPYGEYCAAVALTFERGRSKKAERFIVFAHHGAGGGASTGGRITKLEKLPESVLAQIFLMGHFHEQLFDVKPVMQFNFDKRDPDTGKKGVVEELPRIFLFTGSFLKSYVNGVCTYSERAMYRPNSLGCVRVRIKPYHRELHPERFVA
jgi:hypothetical protein